MKNKVKKNVFGNNEQQITLKKKMQCNNLTEKVTKVVRKTWRL